MQGATGLVKHRNWRRREVVGDDDSANAIMIVVLLVAVRSLTSRGASTSHGVGRTSLYLRPTQLHILLT